MFTFTDFLLEAIARRYSVEKVFLEISQNSQENTCARVSLLIKLQVCLRPEIFLRKRLWHWCFPKYSKIPFLKESLRWLLLFYQELFASKIVRNGRLSSCHVFILTYVACWKNMYFWNKNKKILYFIFI